MLKLPLSFYQKNDVVTLAKQLIGKILYTKIEGVLTGGIITETEAYNGVRDKASHAYGGRRTKRTNIMYAKGGVTYVYLCYGIHYLFNVVTGIENNPQAVLIRAIEPTAGIEFMLKRRKMLVLKPNITAGPGALSQALGIKTTLNAASLLGDEVWIEDIGTRFNDDDILAGNRIGVAYAQEDALLPWRFYLKGNKYVSKPHLNICNRHYLI